MYLEMRKYKFVKFEKSKSKGKKYAAILKDVATGRTRRINFGDANMEQYKDRTGLGLYSHRDHGDQNRRKSFKSRHKGFLKKGYYSASYFSFYYLW